MAETLPIREVARRAGVATSTVRYYDRLGLVHTDERDGSGRRYRPEVLRRLAIIAYFQRAGFRLQEIRRLLDGGRGWQALAEGKRAELAARIDELATAQRLVEAALACGCEDLEGCSAHHEAADLC